MKLRSQEWFEGRDEIGPQSRSVLRSLGWSEELFRGKPIIAIANSWSELNNCSLNLPAVAEAVKRGVIAAGGVPLEFNGLPLGEELMKPSAMLYRNLLSMEVEEVLRSYPIDGVVMLGHCDKSIPALLMAAASSDLPTVMVCSGPKSAGTWNGQPVGSGTALWKYLDEYRAGRLPEEDWQELEACYSCSAGTCNTVGTASTMALIAEALGMMLPGTATIDANDTRRLVSSERAGALAVELVRSDRRPRQIMTREAFENALRVLFAAGGSTNAVIHLLAIAGRLRVPLALEDFDRIAAETPVLLDVQPAGRGLMSDFDASGGLPALLTALRGQLHETPLTVSGKTFGEQIPTRRRGGRSVVRSVEQPILPAGGLAVLRGNLAPRGAIIRAVTAAPQLWQHRGPAVVFDTYDDMLTRIDSDDLPVTADSVLVLRHAGAVGVPGLPEWGSIPVPRKLLLQGVTDIVRISDSRMSGTSSGAVVLHVSPEAAVGGPLALVQDGDMIELDLAGRRLNLLVDEAELARRQALWRAPAPKHRRGYPRLYVEHVLQPDEGCDFDFLRPQDDDDLTFIPPVVGRS